MCRSLPKITRPVHGATCNLIWPGGWFLDKILECCQISTSSSSESISFRTSRHVLHSNLVRIIWFAEDHLILEVQTEMRRYALWNRFFTPRCAMSRAPRPSFKELEYKVGQISHFHFTLWPLPAQTFLAQSYSCFRSHLWYMIPCARGCLLTEISKFSPIKWYILIKNACI